MMARSWSLEYNLRTAFEVADLVQLCRHPGPLYLLDPATCQTNMLPARVAEPGLILRRDGQQVLGWTVNGDGRVLAGGTAYETNVITGGNFEDVSYWNDQLSSLPRDDLAHQFSISTLAANSGERSLRVAFLAAGQAWQSLHEMSAVPVSRRVRISVWVRAGGGGGAPAPATEVAIAMRLRAATSQQVT